VGPTAAVSLAGAVLGALLFAYLTDRLGRKKLFTVTLKRPLSAGVAEGTAGPMTVVSG